MNTPSFTAEASLYKSEHVYRGYSGAAGIDAAVNVVPAQQTFCGLACYAACAGAGGVCGAACLLQLLALAEIGPLDVAVFIACLGACGGGAATCAAGCGPCSACATCTNCHSTAIGWCFCSGENCGWGSPCCAGSGGGGGGGGGPLCCPRGTRCSCGGRCVNLKGGGQACIDGQCLGPNQQCN